MKNNSAEASLARKNNGIVRLWRSLWNSEQSRAGYLLRAWIADVPASLAIVLAVGWLLHTPWPDFEAYSLPRVIFAMCLFAPIMETLIMAVMFWFLRYITERRGVRVLISALIWAGLHATANVMWGVQIFWAFLIFSICYVTWEKKSIWQAIMMTAMLHIAHNAVPAVFLIASRLSH